LDQVKHPLDWWTYGGYAEVVGQTGWSLPKARREVRKAIHAHRWHPSGHAGYARLRRQLMAGELFDQQLT
jgi:hypothetical protein